MRRHERVKTIYRKVNHNRFYTRDKDFPDLDMNKYRLFYPQFDMVYKHVDGNWSATERSQYTYFNISSVNIQNPSFVDMDHSDYMLGYDWRSYFFVFMFITDDWNNSPAVRTLPKKYLFNFSKSLLLNLRIAALKHRQRLQMWN